MKWSGKELHGRDGRSQIKQAVYNKIQNEIDANGVVLFMKGTPAFPQCGFSAAVCQILNNLDVTFSSVDVLADDDVRNEIKEFSDWPTIPQLYVKGEFIGGCDIVREMYDAGELQQTFNAKGIETS